MTTKKVSILTIALWASVSSAACEKKQKKAAATDTSSESVAKKGRAEVELERDAPEVGAARPATEDAGATPETASGEGLDLSALGGVQLGAPTSREQLAREFPDRPLREEPSTAEGTVVGTEYHLGAENSPDLTVRTDEAGVVTSVDFRTRFPGLEDVSPGETTYQEATESLGVAGCNGGIEDTAELLFCETRHSGLFLVFDGSADYAERDLSPEESAKALSGKTVKYARLLHRP